MKYIKTLDQVFCNYSGVHLGFSFQKPWNAQQFILTTVSLSSRSLREALEGRISPPIVLSLAQLM